MYEVHSGFVMPPPQKRGPKKGREVATQAALAKLPTESVREVAERHMHEYLGCRKQRISDPDNIDEVAEKQLRYFMRLIEEELTNKVS